jgi:hypothetical protein
MLAILISELSIQWPKEIQNDRQYNDQKKYRMTDNTMTKRNTECLLVIALSVIRYFFWSLYCLSFCISFGPCIVCHSVFLLVIVLSVIQYFFWSLYCLSFGISFGHCIVCHSVSSSFSCAICGLKTLYTQSLVRRLEIYNCVFWPKYGIIRLLLLKRNLPLHNGRRSADGTGTNWNFPGSQVISFLAKMSDASCKLFLFPTLNLLQAA